MAKVAFIFAGSGTQYFGMGKTLFREDSNFRAAALGCCHEFEAWLGDNLFDRMFTQMDKFILASHPWMTISNFVIQYSLVEFWGKAGISPDLIIVHSSGAHAASLSCGAFSLQEACELVELRCRVLSKLKDPGRMAVVEESKCVVEELIQKYSTSIEIVAVNGPKWTTVSGPKRQVEEFVFMLQESGISARMHMISHGFHSAILDPVIPEYRDGLRKFGARVSKVPIYSSASGFVNIIDEEFWISQLRAKMAFSSVYENVKNLVERVVIEIGPQDAFAKFVRDAEHDRNVCVAASLSSSDTNCAHKSLARVEKALLRP